MSSNFAFSTVATAPSPATSGTSLVVAAGTGGRFFVGTAAVFPRGDFPSPVTAEVIRISAVASDTLTIVRARESSSARAIVAGDVIVQGVTAGMWDDLTVAVGTTAPYVRFTTTGSAFTPTIELAPGSTATVTWAVEGTGLTATGVSPTLNWGSALTRYVRMTVTADGRSALNQVAMINLGYNHTDDAGTYVMGAQYDQAATSVSRVENVHLCVNLIRFAAANITGLVGEISFRGLAFLQYVEMFGSRVQAVDIAGCSSLIRLCLEQNNVSYVDLNPVTANLRDFRGAAQQGGALTLEPLMANLAQLYHFCTRDQVVTNIPAAARLPVVEQLWIWNTGQSGTLASISSAITDLRAYQNTYTAVDLSGRTTLAYIDLHTNSLALAQVDALLVEVDSWGTSNGLIDLTGNAAPSIAGLTARTALLGRGWTVNVAGGAAIWSDDFERADVTGIASIGNGWVAFASGDANIVSGDLVRADSGAYRGVMNPAGSALPADYTVTAVIPHTSITGGFFGIVTRWLTGNGVAVFFNNSMTSFGQLYVHEAANYLQNSTTVTADNAFPASWTTPTVGDHTMAVQMQGTTCQIYLDSILVGHATISTNNTTGTGVGWVGDCVGSHIRSIAVT